MPQVRQLRLVVHAEDLEEALAFYRDALGMPTAEEYADGEARVVILDAGRATLELSNTAQIELIDDVEVGRRVAPHFRVALEVTDAEEMELDDGATIFCFDATVECKLDVETIVADIEKMLPILEKYGVDYDGWGTYFQE